MGLDMMLYKAPKVEGYSYEDVRKAASLLDTADSFDKATKALQLKGTKPSAIIAEEVELNHYSNESSEEFFERLQEFVSDVEVQERVNEARGIDKDLDEAVTSLIGTGEEIGYWRKANHIHAWFVQNVQHGEDDCGEYEVTEEKLRELRDICEKVLKSYDEKVSAELLPTASGFFFGGTDYDSYYYDDVKDTIEILDNAIIHCTENTTIVYSSSW